MSKEKYFDIDSMIGDEQEQKNTTSTRKRRPSPALGALTGNTTATTVTDELKKQNTVISDALLKSEKKTAQLEEELDTLLEKQGGLTSLRFQMPVTKQTVDFELQHIDPKLIDISPENERIQNLLDEISLQDILPSIKSHGQQTPGTVRPIENGRYELIEGSRRLAAVKLAGQDYLARVGDVPDADVRELSLIENKKSDVSPYEKAKAYKRQIDNGEYSNWSQLAVSKSISSSHISRYKACAELNELYVKILRTPAEMPLSYGETIKQLINKDEDSLAEKANELLKLRESSITDIESYFDVEDIIKQLKSSVRKKPLDRPVIGKPVIYKSSDKSISLKHTVTNKGAVKLEITGLSEDKVDSLMAQIQKSLKVK